MNLTFKQPDLQDKEAILVFRRRFNAIHPLMHGANQLNAFTDEGFIAWLNYIAAPAGTQWFERPKVADSTFIALSDGVVVGILTLRHTLNDFLRQYGGHVGYSTHPDYQGQGVATAMLAFGLQTLRALGVDKVLLTCDDTNLASVRVIEKNGGRLENRVEKSNGTLTRRYWIG